MGAPTHEAGVPERLKILSDALKAIRLLRTGRWLIDPLAAELGIGRRSAYRLLGALEAAGIPIQREREGREVYHRVTRAAVDRAIHGDA